MKIRFKRKDSNGVISYDTPVKKVFQYSDEVIYISQEVTQILSQT